jgi:alkylglycerol monooxygenase
MDKSFLIFLAIPVFFLMIGIELLYGYLKNKNNYRLNDTITSINIGLLSRFPTILNLGLQGAAFAYAASYLNMKLLPTNSVFTWVFAFFLYDFLYYWMHRFHHEYKFLWATHVVHHHGEDFNLATALRQTSTGFLWKWIFYLPMFMIGVPASVFVTVAGLNLIYQFWVHTEHIGKLGWFEKIFITPSNHRIHHARNPEYIDANYGGVFILWDRMFGTYIEEKDDLKPIYGTAKPLNSWNPLWANIEVFYGMFMDSYHTKKPIDKLKVWFSKTNWRPEDVKKRFPNNAKLNNLYNPDASKKLKAFAFLQFIMLSPLSMSIYFTITAQTFLATSLFGCFILLSCLITSQALSNKDNSLDWELFRSFLVLLVVFGTSYLPIDLIASKIFVAHAMFNLLFVVIVKSIYSRKDNLAY